MKYSHTGNRSFPQWEYLHYVSRAGHVPASANVPFHFKQTGAHFRKDGRIYNIPRSQQMQQAHKAGIDYAYK